MWLSGSISNRLLALLGAALAVTGGGCATRPPSHPPPPLRGYVDLEALTHSHPGWSGVARYDAALQRLEAAARSLPPTSRPDGKVAALPALSVTAGSEMSLSPADTRQTGKRLLSVQQFLLSGLRARRALARADQIRSQQSTWRRDSRRQYPIGAAAATALPDLELQLLQANVETLTSTLEGWKQSLPPAPKREALRVKVEMERARLQALIAARVKARATAEAQRQAEIQRLLAARTAYVQSQSDTLAARLNAVDARVIADQQARLTQQRTALLAALALPVSASVPPAGDAGPLALPKGPGMMQAALSRASLAEAETRLSAQRLRWVRYLRDDTQAAAQDTAEQRNWDVTFGAPRTGDRNLTQALAHAMKAGAWRL